MDINNIYRKQPIENEFEEEKSFMEELIRYDMEKNR